MKATARKEALGSNTDSSPVQRSRWLLLGLQMGSEANVASSLIFEWVRIQWAKFDSEMGI